MSNPYKIAAIPFYWVFPTSVERLAAVVEEFELRKFALQEDNNTVWILTDIVPNWTQVGGAGGVAPADFTQNFSSAASWTINHNLGREPFIQVLSTGGLDLIAEIVHTSINQAIVYFSTAQAGRIRAF